MPVPCNWIGNVSKTEELITNWLEKFPWRTGEKLTLIEQVCPGFRVAPLQELDTIENGDDGLLTLLIVTAPEVSTLVTMTAWLNELPKLMLPKLIDLGTASN